MIDFVLRTDRRPHQPADSVAARLIVPTPVVSSSNVRFRVTLQRYR